MLGARTAQGLIHTAVARRGQAPLRLDGLEACRRLRAVEGPNQNPVLAVTGLTEDKDIKACRAAGMNGWVAKPIDARQFYDAIESALTEGADKATAAA